MIEPHEDRSAVAVCNVGFSLGPGHEPIVFSGCTYGTIVHVQEGDDGFGWDKIFCPAGFEPRRFSQMTVDEKNKISHRSLALRQFQEWITEHYEDVEPYLLGKTSA